MEEFQLGKDFTVSFLKLAVSAPQQTLQGCRFPWCSDVYSAVWYGCSEQGRAARARVLPRSWPGAQGTSGGN